GKISVLIGWPLVVTYHAARLILGFGLLLMIYRLMAEFVHSAVIRWVAFVMCAVMGGTGWLNVISGRALVLDSLPLDLILPEGFTFLLLYAFPHLILARLLLLWGTIRLWRAGENGSLRAALGAGAIWLIMSVVQPVYGVVVVAVSIAMVAARSIVQRRLDWKQVRTGTLASLLASGMAAYVWLVFQIDPIYGQWGRTPITSPAPEVYAMTYAIPLVLALGGVVYSVHRHDVGQLFLVMWTIIGPLLVYAPTNAQRRLIEGWQIPLSVMAAYGLVRYGLPLAQRLMRPLASPQKLRHVTWIAVVACMTPTYLLMLTWHTTAAATRQPMFFEEGALVAASNWLNQYATYDDGVLAAYSSSTIIPSRAGVRVLLGHPSETVLVDERKADVQRFFQADTSDDWRRDLLDRFRLTYVLIGPAERRLGDFDPINAPYLKEVFTVNDVSLYQRTP
ncbi:MAG TPA: hypothetical protein VFF59_05385, partial [Anaerolineae bacterium]|nr:hypothetical protein [Anaerolineae bacterium]